MIKADTFLVLIKTTQSHITPFPFYIRPFRVKDLSYFFDTEDPEKSSDKSG